MGLGLNARAFSRALLRGYLCACAGLCLHVPDGAERVLLMLLSVRYRSARGCTERERRDAAVWHDADFFAHRELHHDIHMLCFNVISANIVAIRATVRARRGERTKEIYSRISW